MELVKYKNNNRRRPKHHYFCKRKAVKKFGLLHKTKSFTNASSSSQLHSIWSTKRLLKHEANEANHSKTNTPGSSMLKTRVSDAAAAAVARLVTFCWSIKVLIVSSIKSSFKGLSSFTHPRSGKGNFEVQITKSGFAFCFNGCGELGWKQKRKIRIENYDHNYFLLVLLKPVTPHYSIIKLETWASIISRQV